MTQSSDTTDEDEMRGTEISEEEIDETLKESFPASDPPQWTLGVEPHTDVNEEMENDELKDD